MDLKLDYDTWDLDVSYGDLTLVTGIEHIRQQVAISLRMFQGEWELDRRQGFPWLQEILGKKTDPTIIVARIRQIVLSIEGVTGCEVSDVSYDSSTRSLTIGRLLITALDEQIDATEFIAL